MGPKITTDIKQTVKEAIKELLTDDTFLETLFNKVNEKLANMEKKVTTMENQLSKIEVKLENMHQYNKLKNVCIYGIPEERSEKLDEKVIDLINEKVKVAVQANDIIKCYRIGDNVNRKVRPVIVKFERLKLRNEVIRNSRNLKGTRLAVTTDLIKSRLELYRKAQEKFDRKLVRIIDGNIFIYIENKKHKIMNELELNDLQN